MASAMTMRSGNPALTADTFTSIRAVAGTERMTLGGTVNKTALALVILMATASFIWNRGADDPALGAWIMVSVIAGFIAYLKRRGLSAAWADRGSQIPAVATPAAATSAALARMNSRRFRYRPLEVISEGGMAAGRLISMAVLQSWVA